MGQFVMFPSIERRLAKAEQVVVAVGEKAEPFFPGRGAVKVHQIVSPGYEETGKNADVKVRSSGGIAVPKLGPAEIALVF